MSIRICTARAHRLFPAIVKAMGTHLSGDETALLLVPEQFTLAAEQELMRRLHLEGMFQLEVLSPSRLYERVLSAAGRDEREPLSDAGRRMAVSQALEKLEDNLPYYGSITQRRGFVEKLCALITDMKRGGLSTESLTAYAQALPEGIQKAKLIDLAKIYEQYHAVLSGRFSDSEDQLSYVAARLSCSGYLTGKHLYVYGFDTLPQQLMRLLCSSAPLCASLTIGLVCDGENAADGELYAPVRQGIARFRKLLAEDGLSLEICALPYEKLSHAPAIAHLDKALFAQPSPAFDGNTDCVTLFNALTPFEEATLMSRYVMKLLEDGMDIERITVLYPDDSGYEFAVNAALTDSGLPFYTDHQLPASAHGLVQFLLSALRAMADGWRNRDMLSLLKSGYAPVSFEEACELENYLYLCGIDRKRWLSPFTRGEPGLRDRCEALRLRVMDPLLKARQALIRARDAAASMTAVFELLMDVNAYETLKQEEERLLQNGFHVRANQNSQIWQAILTLLDQLVRLGGASRIPLRHIATRLECGFSAISLASLPPAGGMLHAGALGHLLSVEADAVFLLGLNDGLLNRSTESLLTPDERAKTQEDTGCFLGLTDENRMLQARLDLKLAMTLPQKHLFLSYARTSADGAALRPLALLGMLQSRVMPGLQNTPAPAGLPLSATQALSQLSLILRAHADGTLQGELDPLWQERLQKLLRSPSTAPEAMRLLRSLRFDGSAQPLSAWQARALFGEDVLTVSRLEQFAECPFKHFVTYGLRPHVLREWKVDPIETGNFYHTGLNNFARLARRERDYPHLPPERIDAMAEEAIAPLLDELMKGPMGDGERSLARFDQARQAIRRAAMTMTQHLAAGKFALYRTEASFGYEGGMPPIVLLLSDGREIALRGRIDRIDRYDSPQAVYLRVIDYKSSQQTLDAARTWWGLQLQLLLYLDVCTQAIPGAKPAGAFYFYVADPLVESETDAAEVVQGKLREVLQLRGITLSDVEIVTAMDGGDVPCVLPPLYLKSGELKKTARALDEQQFAALLGHAREVATELAQRLFDGDTDISPMREQSRTSCDFCDYRAICHFDPASPDAPLRTLGEMGMEEMRSALSPAAKEVSEECERKSCTSRGFHV